jgi:hypothetical protein
MSISSTNKKTANRADLDSHADTCCAGSNCKVLAETGEKVSVTPFSKSYTAMSDIPIATVATAYDDPTTGEVTLLIIHEALYLGDRLGHTLLCPNQLRANGLTVQETPCQYDSESSHAITTVEGRVLPMFIHGVFSYLPTRLPTDVELSSDCERIELTSDKPWTPYSTDLAEEERLAKDRQVSEIGIDIAVEETELPVYPMPLDFEYQEEQAQEEQDPKEQHPEEQHQEEQHPEETDPTDVTTESNEFAEVIERSVNISSAQTGDRASVIAAKDISRRWGISLETANRTLRTTTQRAVIHVKHPTERRVRTRHAHMNYPSLKSKFYSDTMFSKTKSLSLDTCAQVFVNDLDYTRFYPMRLKSDAAEQLRTFVKEVGIPSKLVVDGALELVGGKWKDTAREFHISTSVTEPYSPWQNRAESGVKSIKMGIRRKMYSTKAPKRLWNFCGRWVSEIRNLTAHPIPALNGRVPEEHISNQTPDISEYIQFDFYDYVYFLDHPKDDVRPMIGRWIGVAKNVGSAMCYYVLTKKGSILTRTTVHPIPAADRTTDTFKANCIELDAGIKAKVGDHLQDSDLDADPDSIFGDCGNEFEPYHENDKQVQEADEFTMDTLDQYLTAQVLLPRGDNFVRGKVVSRKRGANGNPIGVSSSNPILDTREYDVEFPDGVVESYAANVIAENIFSQIDDEGHHHLLLKSIVDHKSDGSAVKADDGFIMSKNGNKTRRLTTKGWKLLVEWKDGSVSWEPLKDMKAAFPLEAAEYAVNNKISEEPAFAWWAKNTLRRRDRIITKVKSQKYWKRTHKFGVELPHSVEAALRIDQRTGTDFWKKAIELEMTNVSPAFQLLDDDAVLPIGVTKISCHMIFDVKMDFKRKARLVAGGHKTDPPKDMTYASVVSRESVRLAFLIAALNGLDILAGDVQNAYLNAETKEKVYMIAGKEFGVNQGKRVLIVRALYGLKSSGAQWRSHMAQTLRDLGFESSKADPDVWFRPAKKANGQEYYEYALVYTDDLLLLSTNPAILMKSLEEVYKVKPSSISEPTQYLGAQVKKWRIDSAADPTKTRWAMSSEKYVKQAVREVETELDKIEKVLPTKAVTPLTSGYRPEMDVSPELDAERMRYYQELIGVLRWICELGRVDILCSVAMLSHQLAMPRQGHLEQCFHVFGYLKKHDRSTMVFDETEPSIDENSFTDCDWREFYPYAKEAIPKNAPRALGEAVTMHCFVDADHAGDQMTRRSHTGVLIFVNRAPITWYSKRQNGVEASTFGSEFIAMKTAVELVEALRYKLRMFGIPINGPTNVFCDNEAVVKNTTAPESCLKKKRNSIAYHYIREQVAAGTIRVAKEHTDTNLADLFTKLLTGPRMKMLTQRVLY